MLSLSLLFLFLALICFLCAAFGAQTKVNLVPLGLAAWVVSLLLNALPLVAR